MLGALEAQLVVPVEGRGADGEGGVADCQTGVREGVGLREFEGVQVCWDGVVGGVF